MDEKDIKIIQDSKIAIQVINKMIKSDKGLNFVYVDNRQAMVDSRQAMIDGDQTTVDSPCIACANPPKQIEDKEIFPNIVPSELGKIPGFVTDEFERVVKRFPQPILGHAVKELFKIAYTHGNTNQQRGEFLGIGKGKFQYWTKKLNIG